MDFEREFQAGFDRHVRNLGYVPPEFQRHGRFDLDDPPEFIWRTTDARMRSLMTQREWNAILDAAELSHRTRNGNSDAAEFARVTGGYGGLGAESFRIPDQRPLLQGGDHDPLD